ncbi:MAG: hypothetical protein E7391_00510 [Ruminococcaceae bacterium]|nr:hypothetical protein [Oscillospiraceae bacterium]
MKNYDLNLSDWGPYNKEYMGVSHIADKEKGVRFDFNLFPGFYRRSVLCPKDICDSGTKILKSSADLSHFVYRYELMWKDEVYIDADFKCDENGKMTVECNVVNNTDESQSISLNGCASIKFPTNYRNDLEITEVEDDLNWVDAIDYTDIKTNKTLAQDGLKLAQKRVSNFVGANALDGLSFDDGFVEYKFIEKSTDKIFIRYSSQEDFLILVEINGNFYKKICKKSDEITNLPIEINEDKFSKMKVYIKKSKCLIDGFIFGEVEFNKYTDKFMPLISEYDKKVILKYAFGTYVISWDCDDYVIRELVGRDAGQILTDSIHNHVSRKLGGNGKGHYADIFIRPIFVDAKSSKKIIFNIEKNNAKSKSVNNDFACKISNSDGQKYKLSQDIMRATTLTNVVFPIYCKQEYIRHNTPGRLWDSLYTWDSGFIGMGLNTVNSLRAKDCLNTYMTEIGDIHSPFIFHGSVVPTQMLLYLEIWNKSTDINFLNEFYPYMEQYYNFFSDLPDKDTILSKTFEIFYNSGGWDDYPPQQYVSDNNLKDKAYPVITTAITVLCAKIMKNIAKKLNRDYTKYDNDIKKLTLSLQDKMWDEKTGYFTYVINENGKIRPLKYNDEINYNMGFDGIYPYIADICKDEQKKRIEENIENGLFTKYGVSVVDTRAPYYSKDGYWNGSIWMPHQWILFKAYLDHGRGDEAYRVAKCALDVWKNEVDLTYNCYEHFMIENGRGAGFHQFSGLSTPVLMWYDTYFVPGNITGGFQTMFDNIKWNDDMSGVEFDILNTLENSKVILCMNENYNYEFFIDDEKILPKQITNGAYEIYAKFGKVKVKQYK